MLNPAVWMASVIQRDSEVLPEPGTARFIITVLQKSLPMFYLHLDLIAIGDKRTGERFSGKNLKNLHIPTSSPKKSC